MHLKILIFLFVIMILTVHHPSQAGIAVIVSQTCTVDELAVPEVRRIFLGKTPMNQVVDWRPLNQPGASGLRRQFERRVLGKSPRQIRSYWIEKIFTGKGTPPKEVKNTAALIEEVAADPNAIGYVDEADVAGKVKSILVIP